MNSKYKVQSGYLSVILAQVIFGLSYLFIKQSTNNVDTITILSWRFTIAFALFNLPLMFGLAKLNFKGKNLRLLLLIALFQPISYFVFETLGVGFTTASETGCVISCIPVATLLCARIIIKEKTSLIQFFGIAISLLGVFTCVLSKGMTASLSIAGYLCLLMAVLSYSLYTVFVRKASEFSAYEITYVMICIGAFVFNITALLYHTVYEDVSSYLMLPFVNTDFFIAVLYLGGASSVLAFLFSNYAISVVGANSASSFIGITTVVSIISGVLFLNESFTLMQSFGVVLVISGVYLANIKKKKA